MKTIGQLVQETIDLTDRGSLELAFVPTCEALSITARKAFEAGFVPADDYQTFIRQYWRLIAFSGVPRGSSSVPADLPFRLRQAVPSFNVPNIAEEIIIFAVRQTLMTHRLPLEIAFNKFNIFEIENDKLLFPKSLISGLLGSIIFHPTNKDEKISERYWLNYSDFKMFISELWGRMDIAERVMNLYLT